MDDTELIGLLEYKIEQIKNNKMSDSEKAEIYSFFTWDSTGEEAKDLFSKLFLGSYINYIYKLQVSNGPLESRD